MGPRSASVSKENACGRCHWGSRWRSQWNHEALYREGGTHAGGSVGTFGGASYEATKRCTGCAGRVRAVPLGPSVGLLRGPRNTALGGGNACGHRRRG
eukprot:9181666-Pyramimonas_sp.AAC.1